MNTGLENLGPEAMPKVAGGFFSYGMRGLGVLPVLSYVYTVVYFLLLMSSKISVGCVAINFKFSLLI